MRTPLLCLFLFFTVVAKAQHQDKTFVFSGYIFSEDSIPFENVHLINYRDYKIVTTNSNGYFKIHVQTGDSLMINHISLRPTIIHVKDERASSNSFYIPFHSYNLGTISTDDYKRERKNLELNMDNISTAIVKDYNQTQWSQNDSAGVNLYDRDRPNAGLDLKGFFKLFRKKRTK